MEQIHAADRELPSWMNNLAEGKITKKASPEEEAFVPYGMNERGTQLGDQTFENFVTELIREDEGEAKVDEEKLEDDQKLKEMEDGTDDKDEKEDAADNVPVKEFPDASGMMTLEERQEETDDIEEKADEEPPPPEPKEAPKDEPPADDEPKDKPEDSLPEDEPPIDDNSFAPPNAPVDEDNDAPEGKGGEGQSEMDELKQGLEGLGEVKDFESRLKRIEMLLENMQGPATADPNMNDSIFQSASVLSDVRRANRIIRRIKTGTIKREDVIKKLNKIFSKF